MKKFLVFTTVVGLAASLAACEPAPTANDKQRDQQSLITSEAAKRSRYAEHRALPRDAVVQTHLRDA